MSIENNSFQWLKLEFIDGNYYVDTSFPISFKTLLHAYITDCVTYADITKAWELTLSWNSGASSASKVRAICSKNDAGRVEAFAIGK